MTEKMMSGVDAINLINNYTEYDSSSRVLTLYDTQGSGSKQYKYQYLIMDIRDNSSYKYDIDTYMFENKIPPIIGCISQENWSGSITITNAQGENPDQVIITKDDLTIPGMFFVFFLNVYAVDSDSEDYSVQIISFPANIKRKW